MRNLFPFLVWLTGAAVLAGAGSADAQHPPAADPDAKGVLTDKGLWRWRVSWRKPIVPVEALRAAGKQAAEPAVIPVQRVPFTSRPDIELLEVAPPPADWVKADFDDSAWPRLPVERFGSPYFQAGALFLRGRFTVADPKAVRGLYLSAEYRGGIVAYLNGREVARNDMPAGPIAGTTPANPYPEKAWVTADGKPMPKSNVIAHAVKAGDKDMADRAASRDRRIGPVQIPTGALRKGVNVLALAVHRSDYHPVALNWFSQQNIHSSWRPIQLKSVSLRAAGSGLSPNVDRPAGPHLWNLDIHQRIDASYYGDANEPLRPIRIVGARNGTFSGAVVLGDSKVLEGVVAKVSDLAQAEGTGQIPASAVDVRYPLLTDGPTRFSSYRRYRYFDALADRPAGQARLIKRTDDRGDSPAGSAASRTAPVAVQPIWIRVNVPNDAPAGGYRGTLAVSANGITTITAPIHLHVADWALPDPLKYRTHVGIYQSPTSLAMKYNVKEWSPEHWKLTAKAFELLGRVGNDLVNVLVVDQTQFGNDDGMIYWIRKGDGWDYDFSVFDRYMALAGEHLGKPTFVALQIWHAGGWAHRKADAKNTVTVIDPKTGRRESMQVPVFGTEESRRFWAPLLNAVRQRLEELGMAQAMCIGILSDSTAPPQVLQMFAQIMPQMGWMRGCHSANRATGPYRIKHGTVVVYHEHCYGMSIANPDKKLAQIWNQHGPAAAYFRSDFNHLPPLSYRRITERAMYQGKRGVGRMGLDFWEFPVPNRKGRLMDLYNRWPHSSCAQRRPTLMHMAWPGAEGPISTVRFELFCEGLQETEAMIALAEAADKHADKLGPELAARCRQMLIDRLNAARVVNGYSGVAARDYTAWQAESARLYAAAAEVARALKGN